MIDEKKLIKTIRDSQDYIRKVNKQPVPVDARDFFTIFIEMVEKEPKIEKCGDCSRRKFYQKGYEDAKSKWIPVSERLPEENKMSDYYDEVIVTLDNGRVVNGCYRNRREEWWVDAEDGEKYFINATGHVIAWRPLPDPYKA